MVTVSVVDPELLAEPGLNEAVTPDGNPSVPKVTSELNPLSIVKVAV